MKFLVTETIEYYINAEDEEDAEAIWLDLPTPEVTTSRGDVVAVPAESIDHSIRVY